MSVTMTITDAGRAALVNATNTGTKAVTITAIGVSSSAIAPSPADTSLAGEIKRISAIGGTIVDPHTIHIAMEDASSDAYALNAFAVYLADGTLFALYGQATPIFTKAAGAIGMLAVDIVLTDASLNADMITVTGSGFTNPPASTTVVGVTRFATPAEAQAGADATIALTPKAAAASVLGWLLGVDGDGSKLDADLLDGKQGAWYADIVARLGFTPLAADSYTPADILAKLTDVDGINSALDADLWRGQTPAQLLAAWFPSGNNANGHWRKMPDGNGGFLIEQWGTIQSSGGNFDFPIEFPQQVDTFVIGNTSSQGAYVDNAFGYPISTKQFYAATKPSNSGGTTGFPVAWIAKGR